MAVINATQRDQPINYFHGCSRHVWLKWDMDG